MGAFRTAFAALLLFCASCLQPFCLAHAEEILPLSPGSSWTYRDLDGKVETLVIKGVVERNGIPLIEATYGGNRSYFYIRGREGIFRLEPTSDPEQAALKGALTLLIKWPLEEGQTWQSPWTDPPLVFTVLSRSTVKVPAGAFPDGLKVGYRPITSPIYTGFIWIVPGVGMLAQEESGYRTELVSYRISDLLTPPGTQIAAAELASIFRPDSPENAAGDAGRRSLKVGSPGWFRERVVPLIFFLVVLALFLAVVLMITRSTGREMDLQEDREVLEAEMTLATSMVREQLYGEAARILRRLTEKNPQWPDIAALLGEAYRNTGRLDEACFELKRALTLNPNMPSARIELVRT
ncbi:MAG: tetratricopeptide repeat protein, partial [bacterium]